MTLTIRKPKGCIFQKIFDLEIEQLVSIVSKENIKHFKTKNIHF